MRTLICVAVRDRALDAFMRPFFMQSIGQAVRSFADEVNRQAQDNPLNAHPEDYDLYMLATWDEDSGKFIPNDTGTAKMIAVGKDQVLAPRQIRGNGELGIPSNIQERLHREGA